MLNHTLIQKQLVLVMKPLFTNEFSSQLEVSKFKLGPKQILVRLKQEFLLGELPLETTSGTQLICK